MTCTAAIRLLIFSVVIVAIALLGLPSTSSSTCLAFTTVTVAAPPTLAAKNGIQRSIIPQQQQTAFATTTTRLFSSTSSNSNTDDDPKQRRRLLQDCVCLVTGASRGIGKGIALELGAQGAIVYITGTTTTAATSSEEAPGTIQETANLITEAGGTGIAVPCDHADDEQVRQLMEKIESEHGKLDILVNNAFRLPQSGAEFLRKNFWEQGPEAWDSIHTVGLRSHYVATCYAMPLLFASAQQQTKTTAEANNSSKLARPLIVMIGSFGGLSYSFNVAYGVGKAGVDRMAKDMAIELADSGICVVSLWPGVVNTERTQYSVKTGEWDKFVRIPLDNAESPNFTGRAVVAVATDDNNLEKSGTYQVVAELAQEYQFTDINGKIPPSIRSLKFLLPSYAFDDNLRNKIPGSWIPDWKLPFWIMAQGRPPDDD